MSINEEELIQKIDEVRSMFIENIEKVSNYQELLQVKAKYIGRNSLLREISLKLKNLPVDIRARVGQKLNEVKKELEATFTNYSSQLNLQKVPELDITLPGQEVRIGRKHPLNQVLDEIIGIFKNLTFEVVEGPEVETDYYNFEALNMPPEHPARDNFSTIYLENGLLLRTHTSPVQIRVMEARQPPLRILAPGRVFREDTPDASHSPVFYQLEGLVVEKDVSFKDLKTVLTYFLHSFFKEDVKVRFVPSYFPFTEPSAEVEVSCSLCNATGCSACGNKGWLEVLGCGMVHPQVFRIVNYDPDIYTGFAFGLGIERLAMLKYRINDIRLFLENHFEFLNQF